MTVRETSGVARSGEYVRRGVPLAITDNVTSTDGMKISTDFTTGYYYRLPPKTVASDVAFNSDPDQRMQPAIDFYDATLQARFDDAFSASASAASDIDDLRRNRPFSWDRGIYSGNFINWYGWRDFGDLVRGTGTYGFGILAPLMD
jgi:hypothetical protein